MPAFAKGDQEILRHFASFVNLRARDLMELTGRHKDSVWMRLRKLGGLRHVRKGPRKDEEQRGLGYVNYVLETSDAVTEEDRYVDPFEIERVYFLTQRGWDKALELGLVQHRVNASDEKSNLSLAHDMKLTDIHLALHRKYGDRLHWFQYRPYIYSRWDDGAEDFVKPDAFFWLDQGDHFPAFFVELENRRETNKYPEGDLLAKLKRFAEYGKGHFQAEPHFEDFRDFRVITYRLSPVLARNMAAKTAKHGLTTGRFWFSDIPSAIRGEETYVTPKDYAERTHSLDAA